MVPSFAKLGGPRYGLRKGLGKHYPKESGEKEELAQVKWPSHQNEDQEEIVAQSEEDAAGV